MDLPGLAVGSSGTTLVVKHLVGALVFRRLDPQIAGLLVVDQSKAWRSAIDKILGKCTII